MMAEVHVNDSIVEGATYSHRITMKGLAQDNMTSGISDLTFLIHPPDLVAGTIFNLRQDLWKFAPADLVATCRSCHANRLMRPLTVIHMKPLIKTPLNFR